MRTQHLHNMNTSSPQHEHIMSTTFAHKTNMHNQHKQTHTTQHIHNQHKQNTQHAQQVWLTASLDEHGAVQLGADSDSAISKGLAAILVHTLSGQTPQQILEVCLMGEGCMGHVWERSMCE